MIWYALQVRGGRELAIARDLRDEGYDVFLPVETLIRRARIAKGKTIERRSIVPLVPSYLFCEAAWIEHKHVFGPISLDGVAYGISDVQLIPLKIISGRETRDEHEHSPITIGQVVRMVDGNLAGLPITVLECTPDQIAGEVALFGKTHRIKVDRERVAT